MCQEVFKIIQNMDLSKVETRLALQCAPVIRGIKVANLLSVQSKDEKEVCKIFEGTEITPYYLLKQGDRIFFLLFRKTELNVHLKNVQIQKIFAEKGYTVFSLAEILKEFQTRFQTYMNKNGDFPHEMGILLGYPVEDVKGFIENNGKNYIYAGYWKVYENLEEKKQLFETYEKAKEEMIIFLSQYM